MLECLNQFLEGNVSPVTDHYFELLRNFIFLSDDLCVLFNRCDGYAKVLCRLYLTDLVLWHCMSRTGRTLPHRSVFLETKYIYP